MRVAPLAALIAVASLTVAKADPLQIATNGAWTTLEDATSETKMCGIQIAANGGLFTVFGASDWQGALRVGLQKPNWHIPGVTVPIVIKFTDDVTFNFTGYGSGATIRAGIPGSQVKSFIHHLTADEEATLTLPEGHEAPWRMDLHGTTPATLALGQCIDATQITLPPPFRAPQPLTAQVTPATAPPDTSAPTPPSSQPASPDQAAAITAPSDSAPMDTATPREAESPLEARPQIPTKDPNDATSPQVTTSPDPRSDGAVTKGGLLAVGGAFIEAVLVGAVALYFIPYIVGSSRKIENQSLLFVTNLLFGWTVFGWFGCLLWAALAQNGIDRALYRKMLQDGR